MPEVPKEIRASPSLTAPTPTAEAALSPPPPAIITSALSPHWEAKIALFQRLQLKKAFVHELDLLQPIVHQTNHA